MITKRKPAVSADSFISSAPDAPKSVPVVSLAPVPTKTVRQVGAKAIISVSIDPAVLARLDGWADENGISRSAALAMAVKTLH